MSKSSNLFVPITFFLIVTLITGCMDQSSYEDLNRKVLNLQKENDSLRESISERNSFQRSNLVPAVFMENSFIHLGDSAEIMAVMSVDSIYKTDAKILLGTAFKNNGVKNVYDTINCKGNFGKIPIYGGKLGSDTIFGVYVLESGKDKIIRPFNFPFDVIE